MLLGAVFDLPARCKATNMKQFNGEYGCLYCCDPGKRHNGARIYPAEDTHKLRTTKEMKDWAALAERTGKDHYGIKGVAVLSGYIDFP